MVDVLGRLVELVHRKGHGARQPHADDEGRHLDECEEDGQRGQPNVDGAGPFAQCAEEATVKQAGTGAHNHQQVPGRARLPVQHVLHRGKAGQLHVHAPGRRRQFAAAHLGRTADVNVCVADAEIGRPGCGQAVSRALAVHFDATHGGLNGFQVRLIQRNAADDEDAVVVTGTVARLAYGPQVELALVQHDSALRGRRRRKVRRRVGGVAHQNNASSLHVGRHLPAGEDLVVQSKLRAVQRSAVAQQVGALVSDAVVGALQPLQLVVQIGGNDKGGELPGEEQARHHAHDQQQHHRDHSDEDVGDDQAVAQLPHEALRKSPVTQHQRRREPDEPRQNVKEGKCPAAWPRPQGQQDSQPQAQPCQPRARHMRPPWRRGRADGLGPGRVHRLRMPDYSRNHFASSPRASFTIQPMTRMRAACSYTERPRPRVCSSGAGNSE